MKKLLLTLFFCSFAEAQHAPVTVYVPDVELTSALMKVCPSVHFTNQPWKATYLVSWDVREVLIGWKYTAVIHRADGSVLHVTDDERSFKNMARDVCTAVV